MQHEPSEPKTMNFVVEYEGMIRHVMNVRTFFIDDNILIFRNADNECNVAMKKWELVYPYIEGSNGQKNEEGDEGNQES